MVYFSEDLHHTDFGLVDNFDSAYQNTDAKDDSAYREDGAAHEADLFPSLPLIRVGGVTRFTKRGRSHKSDNRNNRKNDS